MKFHWKARFCALLLALMTLATTAQAEFAAIVTSGRAAVYADAAGTWLLGTLPATTVVTVRSTSNGIAEIEKNGYVGYAAVSDMKALDELATRVVVNTASRVYQQPNLTSRWLSLPQGMELNLLAVNGPWAMVENGGIVAYTNAAHLTEVETVWGAPAQPEPAPKPEDYGVVVETFEALVTAGSMKVYSAASASSKALGALPKDTQVVVHAYNGEWAYIELSGNFGFARVSELMRKPVVPPTADELLAVGWTIKEVVYAFLTTEMKLNTAAACGVMANIQKESSFNLTAQSYDGGYGLCQWTGGRNTRLHNWCADNEYDPASLEGQLRYLQYELENAHSKTGKYLQSVENSPAGAYDAAYYFCYNFEIPASRAKRSVERGNLAKDKYWLEYAA